MAKKINYHKLLEKKPELPPLLFMPDVSHLAIARDDAFCFLYQAQLAVWRRQNIAISFFSPLQDQAPDSNADMIFLPGGYPELFAAKIAAASNFIAGLRQAAARGAWIYGECGGYMVMGETLEDMDGVQHVMAGLLPHSTRMGQGRRVLGYRIVSSVHHTPFAGKKFRGHEFHYSREDEISQTPQAVPLFDAVTDAAYRPLPPAGQIRDRIFGSYIHLIDQESP